MGRLFRYKRFEVKKTQNNNNNENINRIFKYGLNNSKTKNNPQNADNYAEMYATYAVEKNMKPDKEQANIHKQWWQQILGNALKTTSGSVQYNYYPANITKSMLMRDCDCKQNNFQYEQLDKKHHKKHFMNSYKKRFLLNCWQKSSTSAESTLDNSSIDEDYYVEIESERPENKQNYVNDRSAILKSQELRHGTLVKKAKKQKKLAQKINLFNDHTDTSELNALLATNWFQPQLNCKTAASRLRYSTPGEFIVCHKAANSLQLCLRVSNKVKQYSLIYAQSHYKLKGAKKHFNTLSALITHHSVMAEQLPLNLSLPVNERAKTTTRHADDFVNLETLKILQKLQNSDDLC